VRELAKLLEIFSEEAPEYVFATNNCFFFASLVQEVVTKYSDCTPAGVTWAERTPTKTFGTIMKRYDAACSVLSLLPEEAAGRNTIFTGSTTTLDVDTPAIGPSSGSNTPTHSRRSSAANVARKVTGLFQRRRSTNDGGVSAKGDNQDLTDEPEPMVIGGESSIAADNDAESRVPRNRRAKRTTLSGVVRNIVDILPHRRTTSNKGSIAVEVEVQAMDVSIAD